MPVFDPNRQKIQTPWGEQIDRPEGNGDLMFMNGNEESDAFSKAYNDAKNTLPDQKSPIASLSAFDPFGGNANSSDGDDPVLRHALGSRSGSSMLWH